jgi:hypothetical protein
MKNVGIFDGHLEYITAIWHILWPFDNFVAVLYIFPRFGISNKDKSGNPASQTDQPVRPLQLKPETISKSLEFRTGSGLKTSGSGRALYVRLGIFLPGTLISKIRLGFY